MSQHFLVSHAPGNRSGYIHCFNASLRLTVCQCAKDRRQVLATVSWLLASTVGKVQLDILRGQDILSWNTKMSKKLMNSDLK